jgi:nucleoside-diphosphate-sugar epimerase
VSAVDVFVTGGSGFLGQHVLRALRGAGHAVRALARTQHSADVVRSAGAEPVRGDLGDAAALRKGMAGCDAVVHAAAHTEQWGPQRDFERVNVDGTAAVLDAARHAAVGRLVHVSTEAVLADGRPLVGVDEAWPRPARVYGAYAETKARAEDLVRAANDANLATVVVRPRLVWGPGDATVLPAVVAAARAGRFAWIDGGRYRTSTCHATNAAAGIVLAVERGRGSDVYFLTDGEPVEFREFLTALAATAGVALPGRSLPRPLAWAAATALEAVWRVLPLRGAPPLTRTFLALSAQEMTVDDGKARRELGYRPVVQRSAGLAALAN